MVIVCPLIQATPVAVKHHDKDCHSDIPEEFRYKKSEQPVAHREERLINAGITAEDGTIKYCKQCHLLQEVTNLLLIPFGSHPPSLCRRITHSSFTVTTNGIHHLPRPSCIRSGIASVMLSIVSVRLTLTGVCGRWPYHILF